MGSHVREERASIIKSDALKVLPDLDLDEGDSGGDEAKVPLTRTANLYADSPRETQVSDGISDEEIAHRRRVGISMLIGLLVPAIQHHFIAATSAKGFKTNLEYYAGSTRHTGSTGDLEMANFIRSQAIEHGIDEDAVTLDEFNMLVNEPETLTLETLQQSSQNSSEDSGNTPLAFYDFVAEHSAKQLKRQNKGKNVVMPHPAFHLYAKNGTAVGALVYAHFGASADYEALARANVSVAGKIALVRIGGDVSLPAKVVLAANDPADDGSARGRTAPDGPWRPSSTAAFGSVYMGDGDPTMPEGSSATCPTAPYADRFSVDDIYSENNTFNVLPPVVSMPISAVVAQELLAQAENAAANVSSIKSLEAAEVFGSRWEGGGLGGRYQLVVDEDASSSAAVGIVVKMTNKNVFKLATTWNVAITLRGSREPDRHVIVGAPRDSLNAGAASPGSGNAVLLEVVRALGTLLSNGWRPHRTLILASFGGEQFGAVGSSHWIDRYADFESGSAGRGVVYLQMRDAVRGAGALRCEASATIRKNIYLMTAAVAQPQKQSFPDVDSFFYNISADFSSADESDDDGGERDMLPINATFSSDELPDGGNSVFAYWLDDANKKSSSDTPLELPPMGRPGAFQDGRIPPFLGRLGIPSLELGFDGGYFGVEGSSADSPTWISYFADPQFAFHRAAAELYGSILLSFTDAQFLQYDFTELSRELRRGETFLADALAHEGLTDSVSLTRLHEATTIFEAAAISASHEMTAISNDPAGSDAKRVLYGISEWDDYRLGLFPGVTQELKRGNAMTVRRELVRLCLTIETAADILVNSPDDD
ncbi:hypothetical protein BBJ28_00010273 [Nothophytophthora sp. Chile5]|nr:hypothetical protein BBJ28_00010273 [Nothophytophthora sp. Chile5]